MINTASTVIVALISRAIEFVTGRLKEVLPSPVESSSLSQENGDVKQKAKRRRRRRHVRKIGVLSDDELSDNSEILFVGY